MYPELANIIRQAEEKYLVTEDLDNFSSHISSLKERLETYELIRDNEISMFQSVADQLLQTFSKEKPQKIEKALKRWLLINRYASMAMLLNNSDFLNRRLLEWLTDIVKIDDLQSIENKLLQFLNGELAKILTKNQIQLIQPFLDQAKSTLFNSETLV